MLPVSPFNPFLRSPPDRCGTEGLAPRRGEILLCMIETVLVYRQSELTDPEIGGITSSWVKTCIRQGWGLANCALSKRGVDRA
jgi:hypothetical protein